MLSKNQLKLIISLQQKKNRNKQRLFVAEGIKLVNELLQSAFELAHLFCTEDVLQTYKDYKPKQITDVELKKVSTLKTPNKILALFKIPDEQRIERKGLILALDGVNDPGNLGTIIRLCDWFGISQLVCSSNTVDCYNNKVIQSTMGSITRVNITYTDLSQFLNGITIPIYGAVMNGKNVYSANLEQEAVLVMGSEANGISSDIEQLISYNITIPRFGNLQKTESLNVATATAILLNEFRRG